MKNRLLSIAIYFSLLLFSPGKIFAQPWTNLGGGFQGYTGIALTLYNNELYAGGNFIAADSIYNIVNCVAKWNGSHWIGMAGGANNNVVCFAEYNGELYCGGSFSGIGGLYNTYGIAKWNGTGWDSLSPGISQYGAVSTMTVYNGKLIVAGIFDSAGNVPVNNIAAWDGTSWSALGNGLSGQQICALEIYNGNLVAGGGIDSSGNIAIENIAQWDGNSWSQVGDGFIAPVFALKNFNGSLYAGGAFFCTGGYHVMNNISRWDGANWNALGSGANYYVYSLCVYGNKLFVGGEFSLIDNIPARSIACWNGNNFSALGSGMGPNGSPVFTMVADDGILYAAGSFNTAGGNPALAVAQWNILPDNVSEIVNNPSAFLLPNPSNGIFKVVLKNNSPNSEIEIYNSLGEKISDIELKDESTTVDLSHEAKGIYFYRILSGKQSVTSGKIVKE